jgi:hypothetical protein
VWAGAFTFLYQFVGAVVASVRRVSFDVYEVHRGPGTVRSTTLGMDPLDRPLDEIIKESKPERKPWGDRPAKKDAPKRKGGGVGGGGGGGGGAL